ncbi:hypothetical protein VT99_10845 [Candidatus Electrothrix marina]|uniref:Uncharacterized protein n=1 Tax=Candidatus Electrothrix marina TaxID=1859130 RepID=A0A444J603_9BACT|nr:hypothetical protein VT99_10845 [Candidatus Electrothrix marina]
MKNYHIKMSLPEFNEYIHHVVQQGTLDNFLQRYDQDELTLLAEKMVADLERWRDKENMYPEDWAQVIAAINSSSSDPSKSDTIFQEGEWKLHLSYRAVGTRSEHQYGTLTYKGEVVHGRELGEEKDTDLGLLRYYGESPSEMSPWERTGWHFC